MSLDNKEFWAVSASDVVKTYNKIMKIIDSEINIFREGKLTEKELAEMEEQGICETVADVLEALREPVEEELWIDQFGDEPPKMATPLKEKESK